MMTEAVSQQVVKHCDWCEKPIYIEDIKLHCRTDKLKYCKRCSTKVITLKKKYYAQLKKDSVQTAIDMIRESLKKL